MEPLGLREVSSPVFRPLEERTLKKNELVYNLTWGRNSIADGRNAAAADRCLKLTNTEVASNKEAA
jgi:hypothetical protein